MRTRRGHGRTVRGTLMGTYAVLILLSFAVLATAFSLIHGSRVRNEVMNTLRGQTQAMAAAADREIDQMRTMALNITYSTRMQDRITLRRGNAGSISEEADRMSMILSLIVFRKTGTGRCRSRRTTSCFSFPAGMKSSPNI